MDIALRVVQSIGEEIYKDFTLDGSFKSYYMELIKYFHGDQSFDGDLSRGLLITGPTGTGKTLSMEVMKYYRAIDKIKFFYSNKPVNLDYRLLTGHSINHAFMEYGYDGIQTFINESVLYLDDFGVESRHAVHYGTRLDAVEYVLIERHRLEKLTFATSNLTVDQLLEVYGDRLYSRFKQMFNLMNLTGSDLR
jgi:DNA replication protein DnaC